MADTVTRSPARLCSGDGKLRLLLLWTPKVRFSCSCALLHTFLISSFICPHPGVCIFVLLRLCSSHVILSASTYQCITEYVFFLLVLFVSCVISEFLYTEYLLSCFFSYCSFSGGVFVVLSYPLRFDLLTLILDFGFTPPRYTVCDHITCISLGSRIKDAGGSADVVG